MLGFEVVFMKHVMVIDLWLFKFSQPDKIICKNEIAILIERKNKLKHEVNNFLKFYF